MLELLTPLAARRILIHINNTNPILDEDSPERAALVAAGIEVAYDGMEIEL
jgi:pyrroloquinoline quinone biosynthesis protein B